jgi:hypothetical protein
MHNGPHRLLGVHTPDQIFVLQSSSSLNRFRLAGLLGINMPFINGSPVTFGPSDTSPDSFL